MRLFVHRSGSIEALADRLADRLVVGLPEDPLIYPTVLVGSLGMSRWLGGRIAVAHGISAGVEYAFPSAFLDRVVEAAAGVAEPRWSSSQLPFELWEHLAQALGPEGVAAWGLEDVLRAGAPMDRRALELAQTVGEIVQRAQYHRPDWLVGGDWDGPEWWPVLWGRLVEALGEGHAVNRWLAAGKAKKGSLQVPPVHVFGVTQLAPLQLDALKLLAKHTSVEIYALTPTTVWFGDWRTRGDRRKRREPATEPATATAQNPLLTAFGRVFRDAQTLIEERLDGYRDGDELPGAPPTGKCLLGWLHEDLRDGRSIDDLRTDLVARTRKLEGDDSVSIHVSHGIGRQAEVAEQAILTLLERHPDLQPRDVVLMVPDLALFGPLVASWRRLRGVVVDAPLRSRNPAAEALVSLLNLSGSRRSASEVVDLLAMAPVAHRFALTDEDLVRVREWVDLSGIRWAIDGRDRRGFEQPEDSHNTWMFGLERLVSGIVARPDDGLLFGVSPLGIEGTDAVRAFGRFYEAAIAVLSASTGLQTPRSAASWRVDLQSAVEAVFDLPGDQRWMVRQVLEIVGGLGGTAERPLARDAVLAWLEGELAAPPRHQVDHGAVTVCSLSPMRAVPFPVVVLAGLDGDSFPRKAPRAAFDPLGWAPRPGDPDRRETDRHLFLEALLSARRHFVVVVGGRDPKSNDPRPWPSAVADLFAAASLTVPGLAPDVVREKIVVEHALQPFSAGAFGGGPWSSSDQGWHGVMEALHRPRAQSEVAPAPLEIAGPGDGPVDVDELTAGLVHPSRWWVERVLGVRTIDEEPLQDREPIEITALESSVLRRRWLEDRLAAKEAVGVTRAASGDLPLGASGALLVAEYEHQVDALLDLARQVGGDAGELVERRGQFGGVTLSGTVRDLRPGGAVLLVSHSPTRPTVWLRAWLTACLLAEAGRPGEAVVIGWEKAPTGIRVRVTLEEAQGLVPQVVRQFREGRSRRIPLLPNASLVVGLNAGQDGVVGPQGLRAVHTAWVGGYDRPGDEADEAVRMMFGRAWSPFEAPDRLNDEFVNRSREVWSPVVAATEELS